MSSPDCMPPLPRAFALFEKRIDGDDALLHLARARFREACLGAEFYAHSPGELDWLLRFRPFPEVPSVVHMSRSISLFDSDSRDAIIDCAARFRDEVYGIVVHDEEGITARFDEYVAILRDLQSRLTGKRTSPFLFIEYAVGLDPETFLSLFMAAEGLSRVSCCVDIGHLGIRLARDYYAQTHPGDDICSLRPDDADLHRLLGDIEASLRSAVDTSVSVISRLCCLGKQVHFHLHDAHPLSTASPFGVSDHVSFLEDIAYPSSHRGNRSLPPMFGPAGLSRVLEASLTLPPQSLSYTIEIHPSEGREALGLQAPLFVHWVDFTNAEKMNHWLSVLIKNYTLLRELLGNVRSTPRTGKGARDEET